MNLFLQNLMFAQRRSNVSRVQQSKKIPGLTIKFANSSR